MKPNSWATEDYTFQLLFFLNKFDKNESFIIQFWNYTNITLHEAVDEL